MKRMWGEEGGEQGGTQNVAQQGKSCQELGYLNRKQPKRRGQKCGRTKIGGCGGQ